jgi:hypothetical protein
MLVIIVGGIPIAMPTHVPIKATWRMQRVALAAVMGSA